MRVNLCWGAWQGCQGAGIGVVDLPVCPVHGRCVLCSWTSFLLLKPLQIRFLLGRSAPFAFAQPVQAVYQTALLLTHDLLQFV